MRASGRRICFMMLNPSTADATKDDPTIRRCIGFAQRWNEPEPVAALTILNLFALRSTDPGGLLKAWDPVGPSNVDWIVRRAADCDVICAWGANANRVDKMHSLEVLNLLGLARARTYALAFTLDGSPAHPLYLRSSLTPQRWRAA